MLRALDLLGPLKWPSVLAVTVLPAASFALLWGDFDRAQPERLYAAARVGGVSLRLARVGDGSEARWCLRASEAGRRAVDRAAFAFGDAKASRAPWIEATADGADACAALGDPRAGSSHVWVEVETAGEGRRRHSWLV